MGPVNGEFFCRAFSASGPRKGRVLSAVALVSSAFAGDVENGLESALDFPESNGFSKALALETWAACVAKDFEPEGAVGDRNSEVKKELGGTDTFEVKERVAKGLTDTVLEPLRLLGAKVDFEGTNLRVVSHSSRRRSPSV